MGLRRILRCNPWGGSGDDPVPPRIDPAASSLDKTAGGGTLPPRSRVNREGLDERQAGLGRWTSRLIQLRKTIPSLGAGDAKTNSHKVWVFDEEQVLVIHRWMTGGGASLLVLSFNAMPSTVTLHEPIGTWRLSAFSLAAEFGGPGVAAAPSILTVSSQGESVALPAYIAALFTLAESNQRP